MLPARLARESRRSEELARREERRRWTTGHVVAEEREGVASDGQAERDERGANTIKNCQLLAQSCDVL